MPDGILNWKKCKRCGRYFDAGTNYDLCSTCRYTELNKQIDDEDDYQRDINSLKRWV